MMVVVILLMVLLTTANPCNSKKIVSTTIYPREQFLSVWHKNGEWYHGSLSSNSITCFQTTTIVNSSVWSLMMCLIPPLYYFTGHEQCHALWGSSSIVVNTGGNIELVKVNIPPDEQSREDLVFIEVEKLVDLEPSVVKKILQIPSEPVMLCARSTDLFGRNSSFDISFRETFLRDRDQLLYQEEVIFHFLALLISSSSWCFPYFAALSVASFVYANGIQVTISLLCFSGLIICLAPVMFTAKNRHLIYLYLSYFFGPLQHSESRYIAKERKSIFHALFLSSVLMIFGSILCYVFYHYFGIHRELRNTLLKMVITVSISWFSFFLGRCFDASASGLSWALLTLNIARRSNILFNPSCHISCCVVIGGFSYLVSMLARKFIHSSVLVEKVISGIIISRASIYNLILTKISRSSLEGNLVKREI